MMEFLAAPFRSRSPLLIQPLEPAKTRPGLCTIGVVCSVFRAP
jgi:hypothetical protein